MATVIWAKVVDFTRWDVIRHLRRDRAGGLRQRFLAPVRILLPESILDRGWTIVTKSFGPLEHVGDSVINRGWLITSIKVPLRFQHASFGMLFHMTLGGSLVGLRFLPLDKLGLGEGWQVPAYVDCKMIESEITLGKGKLKVGGTLCLPPALPDQPKFPCVVFIPGSGPCDRHSTVEANQPFKDLAWGLACQGIASIRFDKVTYKHSKAFRNRKNVTLTDEYVEYVADAVRHAHRHPSILPDQIFLLGHSLGVVIAPKVAALDASVAGCILMAGPAQPIYRCLVRQIRYTQSLDGPEAPYLGRQIDAAQAQAELADSDSLTLSTPAKKLPFGIGPSYWLDYRKFDPVGTASALEKPILVLQGGRDYQVTVKDDYQRWQSALQGQSNVQFGLYPRLNHLFIAGDGPSTPLEYLVPGNVDEQVITDIATWVLQ
ncbi:Alpha/Beta hydrolase protein [Aspergillus granulosus]|uniref:Alpha/Beta hydrolase protein n=1 Tax=Aspergillus granulosus TaxID=176169 RepID=A0ABR4HS61_9EURO